MEHEISTITLPAAWASAIINGDYSGLDYHDPAEAQRCRERVAELRGDGWDIVDCEDEAHFTWSYRLADPGADCYGGDVLEYAMVRRIAARSLQPD